MPARSLILAACLVAVAGCAPKVGSEAWCKKLDAKPKGDWTTNEATNYATHCLFRHSQKSSD